MMPEINDDPFIIKSSTTVNHCPAGRTVILGDWRMFSNPETTEPGVKFQYIRYENSLG